jgi:hypothetical protein
MSQTKLYIFTTSDNPDPYINAIAHCVVYYKELNQVTLIEIIGDRRRTESKKNDLNKLRQNIDDQLENLSKSKYFLKRKDNTGELLDIQIESTDCEMYARLKDVLVDVKVWIYDDLEREVSDLLICRGLSKYIFDVTAVLKSQLVDVYIILKSKNINAVHSFELVNKPFHDYRDLIHNFEFEKTYKYPCLAESFHTKDISVANIDSIISRRDFDQLTDIAATDFARFCLLIYFLIGLPILVLIGWYISPPERWSTAEPIILVITSGLVLLSYPLQSLFSGKAPSLDPRELFNALKSWRKKGLEKSRLNSSSKL